jgi:thymidylate synthase (FAD)
VQLMSFTHNPQQIAAAGALGCFEEKSSLQLRDELSFLSEEERLKKERGVLKNSFGRGHGSIGDQCFFTFSIENLTRLATLQLCLPQYASHLQQSLRRAKADRGFYLPPDILESQLGEKTKQVLSKTFDIYERMLAAGIPGEDARFLLPLFTRTNIQTTIDARELCHLWLMSQDACVPTAVKEIVEEMMSQAKVLAPSLFEDFGFNYERLSFYPSSQLFARHNEFVRDLTDYYLGKNEDDAVALLIMTHPRIKKELIEEAVRERDEASLANLKHFHFEFFVPMSLACFHQATRQRTWDQSIESIYDAAEDAIRYPAPLTKRMVVPPSIANSSFFKEYQEIHQSLFDLYANLNVVADVPVEEAVGVLPHSLRVCDIIHINGWNAIHSIGKRTCREAQWEIRSLAWKMANQIKSVAPAFKNWVEPQCITYGRCPETKDCGYYKTKNNKQ